MKNIKLNSLWIRYGRSKKRKYRVVNVSDTSVYFYNESTGAHCDFCIAYFLDQFKEVGE